LLRQQHQLVGDDAGAHGLSRSGGCQQKSGVVVASRNPELHPVTTTEDLAAPCISATRGEKIEASTRVEEDEAREEEGCVRRRGRRLGKQGGCGSVWREGGGVGEGERWAASGSTEEERPASNARERGRQGRETWSGIVHVVFYKMTHASSFPCRRE
jgi:hypothetical protein